ncbi:dephospho-CoA kinase [Synechococcus sp. NB0720_010]|uniref:dephospho-CoA kinase n=1 Tax=Synechococcus sp. NB0720_010 TaxID=2907159 RepID=UPI001FF7C3CD|nr:dephospho-CoA kinase [Synechococcus sp. NB0720_010]UPH89476.1 dephospho-CoA kinase [Synechococcus sp. NB0720_010]
MGQGPRWQGQQRRIGLTGGIATGKSTVGRLLEAEGLPVLDADQYAREALALGSPGAAAVLERFGDAVRTSGTGPECPTIDRGALGSIVFSNPTDKRWLEQLVHPLVRQRFELALAELAAESAVVLMIPLLFEAGLQELCSEIWLVDCDEKQQLERLIQRDAISQEAAQQRIASQWSLEVKRKCADVIIDNRQHSHQLSAAVEKTLKRNKISTLADPKIS